MVKSNEILERIHCWGFWENRQKTENLSKRSIIQSQHEPYHEKSLTIWNMVAMNVRHCSCWK